MKTAVKVFSVIDIVLGVILLIAAIIALALGGILAGSRAGGLIGAAVGGVVVVLGIISLLEGIFYLLMGIFGFQGAKGNVKRLRRAFVFGVITLVLAIINVIAALAQGTANPLSFITLIIPILFVVFTKKLEGEYTAAQNPMS